MLDCCILESSSFQEPWVVGKGRKRGDGWLGCLECRVNADTSGISGTQVHNTFAAPGATITSYSKITYNLVKENWPVGSTLSRRQ